MKIRVRNFPAEHQNFAASLFNGAFNRFKFAEAVVNLTMRRRAQVEAFRFVATTIFHGERPSRDSLRLECLKRERRRHFLRHDAAQVFFRRHEIYHGQRFFDFVEPHAAEIFFAVNRRNQILQANFFRANFNRVDLEFGAIDDEIFSGGNFVDAFAGLRVD